MAIALVIVNLVGGASALASASVTPRPAGLTLPIHPTYILGLFLVNGLHGVMHLLIGSLGLLVTAGPLRPEAYLTGHTIWFAGLGVLGLVAVPELAPPHTMLGLAINVPDHVAHLVLASMSVVPYLLTARRESQQPRPDGSRLHTDRKEWNSCS
jgi:hypothetical protein